MLKDRESFAILLADTETDLIVIVQNIALRKHIKYNRVKLKDDVDYSFVLYTEPQDKQYVFDIARNKKLKMIWKDNTEFYVIDFSTNTKGDIICNLTTDVTDKGTVDGNIITPKLKSEFDNVKKVMLISSQQLDKVQQYNYEEFKFYKKEVLETIPVLYKLNSSVAELYHKQLLNNTEALEYLKSRNVSNNTIEKLKLGYASKDISLYDYLIEQGYTEDDILASRLVKDDKSNMFTNRIIFPIINEKEQVVSFGSRVIDDSQPKYLNGAETYIYLKADNLYGISISKNYAQDGLILVEGYFDCITLYQSGIKNVVALLGTAITDEQIELIKKYTNKVTLILDSDLAGQQASIRAVEKIKKYDIKCFNVRLEKAKDVDEFINIYGIDEFKKLLQNDDLEA